MRFRLFEILLCSAFLAGIPANAGGADEVAGMGGGGRYRLLFDDYYQKDRTGKPFSQGVALRAPDRALANNYAADSNANSNGTFALAQLIADKFQVEMCDQPISEALLQKTDAYLLICPIKADAGGRASLKDREARLLESFVARGGMLALIFNSLTDVTKTDFDYEGMNRIARKFGIEFLLEETSTVSVPVPDDHPVFDGVDAVIYGSGTTLRLLSSADPASVVLLRDPREKSEHAPIGVIAPYKKGRVLAFGDAGTFGNAHVFRSDLKQAKALQQMFFGLLPEGPAPRYGWKKGQRMRVTLKQEQMVAGYEFENRLLALPHPKGSVRLEAEARPMDINSAQDKVKAAEQMGYTTVLARHEATFGLQIGEYDGQAYAAEWIAQGGGTASARLLSKGKVLELSIGKEDAFASWRWALAGELFCAPLKAYAQPGEVWDGDGLATLPHAQLSPVPVQIPASAKFRFEGEESYAGKACYLFSRTIFSSGQDWRFQDFVSPDSLPLFGPDKIQLLSRGQMAVTKYWIERESRLPVRTEMTISSSIWWKDSLYPERYVGSHDWRNFENFQQVNFIADFGRKLTADFEVEHSP